MVFGRKPQSSDFEDTGRLAAGEDNSTRKILVVGSESTLLDQDLRQGCTAVGEDWTAAFVQPHEVDFTAAERTSVMLAVFLDAAELSAVNELVCRARAASTTGYPVLAAAVRLDQLSAFGSWLEKRAAENKLDGLRIIAADQVNEIPEKLRDVLDPIQEPSVLRMPVTPEVETTSYKYFYAISPQLRRVARLMREFAENSIARVYLLGAPGAGKTTLAYYYWLCRGKGRFVAVNLTAESTDDKTAMKSLLCGHVAGSCGPHSREGALAFAEDGVCFLDESHGVTGVVMQVLMEVLDSGQYLQFGATKKRTLECAVIFASNRSWDSLRGQIHLDEYARLGTTIINLSDLRYRQEDLIAVFAATLAKFARGCTTWTAPKGIAPEAWKIILSCPWKGNVRTLIRVVESAAIAFAAEKNAGELIEPRHVTESLALWEPEEHPTADIYAAYR